MSAPGLRDSPRLGNRVRRHGHRHVDRCGQDATVHVRIGARFERDRISERTREALAVKRAQGVRLGRPSTLSLEVVTRIVVEREAGSSLRAIADRLTVDGMPTAQGGQAWYASTVRKVLASQQCVTHCSTELTEEPYWPRAASKCAQLEPTRRSDQPTSGSVVSRLETA